MSTLIVVPARYGSTRFPGKPLAEINGIGSDRALSAAQALTKSSERPFDYIINLQGDAPFTPVSSIVALAETIKTGADVATPYIQLSWMALDALRQHKNTTPFSGTTVIVGPNGHAIWFSKL